MQSDGDQDQAVRRSIVVQKLDVSGANADGHTKDGEEGERKPYLAIRKNEGENCPRNPQFRTSLLLSLSPGPDEEGGVSHLPSSRSANAVCVLSPQTPLARPHSATVIRHFLVMQLCFACEAAEIRAI